jgi:hypothetical protein
LNGKYDSRKIERIRDSAHVYGDDILNGERLIDETHFNLTHPNNDRLVVVVARRGASIDNIVLVSSDVNGVTTTRSIVVHGGEQSAFGCVRFGFDDPKNSLNVTNQLPINYPFVNVHQRDWSMYGDVARPHRVRFVHGLVQIIYQFSLNHPNEFSMTTMVATPSDQPVVADPTNNIYFNLRGHGNLSTVSERTNERVRCSLQIVSCSSII